MTSRASFSESLLHRINEELVALRHVAALMAGGASPSEVFTAVADEIGRMLGADYILINRYGAGPSVTVVASWRAPGSPTLDNPFGERWSVTDESPAGIVLRTRRAARCAVDLSDHVMADWLRSLGIGHLVGCPAIVGDRLWAVIVAAYRGSDPPPEETEQRMAAFVELLSSAIAQAEIHAELMESQTRLVAESDSLRRRIECDLHEGPQEHLNALALQLRAVEARVPPTEESLKRELSRIARHLGKVNAELQDISRALHPAMLTKGGLEAALRALVRRCPVPAEFNFRLGRQLTETVELTLYQVVCEALTNVLRYAHALSIHIDLSADDEYVLLSVRDDGIGRTEPSRGSALSALQERVKALGGTLAITSPAGGGTSLSVTMPFGGRPVS
jgi:signal transduction histidine kinase